jgi:hypothetical protein
MLGTRKCSNSNFEAEIIVHRFPSCISVGEDLNSRPLTIDPTGRFLYTANQVSNSVNAYTIDSTGALTPVLGLPYWLPFPAGLSPSGITSTAGPATGLAAFVN